MAVGGTWHEAKVFVKLGQAVASALKVLEKRVGVAWNGDADSSDSGARAVMATVSR
jgi:hypothetical protein